MGLEVDLAGYAENVPFLLEMEEKEFVCDEGYRGLIEQDFASVRFFADSWETMPTWLLDDDASNDDCTHTPYSLQYPKSFADMNEAQEKNLRHTMYDLFESAELGLSIGQLGLDMDSFVNYYLFMEVFSSTTFVGPSVFMYRGPNSDQIKMGPLWDFDTAMFGGTDGSVDLERNTLYNHLYKYRAFREALVGRFEELEERLFPLIKKSITALGENEVLKSAVSRAEAKYNTWGRSLNRHNDYMGATYDIPDPNVLSYKSLKEHVDHLTDWLFDGYDDVRGFSAEGRLVWMKENVEMWAE
ncbi:MAG: CotH kinase family protein [Candidatus Saccharimonadales bacterium]